MDIVVPVRGRDPGRARKLRELHDALHDRVPLSWTVRLVDADDVAGALAGPAGADLVVLLDLDRPGAADAVLPLLAPVLSGRADVAVGSVREARGPVDRGLLRLLRLGFAAGDTRCGLLAARAAALRPLLGAVRGGPGRLATEVLLLARHHRLRVQEVAVDPAGSPAGLRAAWSHAATLLRTTYAMVTGRALLPRGAEAAPGPPAAALVKLVLFGIVGALSGVLYVLVYLPFREFSAPAVANFAALAAAALFNIEANRLWTFGTVEVARVGMHLRSALLFAAHYVLTTGAVVALELAAPDAGKTAELVTLLSADLLMTLARFVGLDQWVFRRRAVPPAAAPPVLVERSP